MQYMGLFLSVAGLLVSWFSGRRQTSELACVRSENARLLTSSKVTLFVSVALCVATLIIVSRKAA
jgi:hypothetical protein